MRYFLELSYNGAAYCGWQRQPDMPSVQQAVEQALATLLRSRVDLTGAGRTDTGVHASYYVAHFDCAEPVADPVEGCAADFSAGCVASPAAILADPARALYKLNFILPPDISALGLTRVADDAHARYDAREREYRYYIEPHKNPFTQGLSWQYYVPLDVERMNVAAAYLLQYDDFMSFAKLHSNNKTTLCRITHAAWTVGGEHNAPGSTLCFTIRADRFLRNMVRSLVGTLVDVGRGHYTPEQFREIIESRDLSRSSAGAPAGGLFLSDVRYDNGVFINTLKR